MLRLRLRVRLRLRRLDAEEELSVVIDGVGEWNRSYPSEYDDVDDEYAATLVGIGVDSSRNPKYGTSSPSSQPARTHTSSISVMMNPYRQECSRMQRCRWASPLRYSTRRGGDSLRIAVFHRSKLFTIPTRRPRGRPELVCSVSQA